ncbi:Importin subunit alpha-1 [Chamberlinius hualienensis]
MSASGSRYTQFKNRGKDSESLRRQRSDVTVELRKQKKDDQLFKRRNVNLEDDLNESKEEVETPTESIDVIIEGVNSSDPNTQLKYTQIARRMLSREYDPPINIVINAGIVPRFVEFLKASDLPALQMEAAWALTNIASGNSEQTTTVVNAGAVEHFVALVNSPVDALAEQAVWALGNVAGDGAEMRDLVIKAGIVDPILNLMHRTKSPSVIRNVAWTLSNLCRNKNPSPPFNVIKRILPYLSQLLCCEDFSVVTDACWAFSYLSDGTNDKISEVIQCNIIQRMVFLLNLNDTRISTPALRVIGNIVTGTEEQTQVVVDSGVLSIFPQLLSNPKPSIQKEAAWTISNILAGTSKQIQAVIDANLIEPLRDVLEKGDFRAQKEAMYAVTNLTSGGTDEQIAILVITNFVPAICQLFTVKDPKIVLIAMDALYNILTTAKRMNDVRSVCDLIEECGALDKIERLQTHDNRSVYFGAYKILEEFFEDEEEEEESNVANGTNEEFTFTGSATTNNQFQF